LGKGIEHDNFKSRLTAVRFLGAYLDSVSLHEDPIPLQVSRPGNSALNAPFALAASPNLAQPGRDSRKNARISCRKATLRRTRSHFPFGPSHPPIGHKRHGKNGQGEDPGGKAPGQPVVPRRTSNTNNTSFTTQKFHRTASSRDSERTW